MFIPLGPGRLCAEGVCSRAPLRRAAGGRGERGRSQGLEWARGLPPTPWLLGEGGVGGADQAGSGAAHRARGTQWPERGNPPTARGSPRAPFHGGAANHGSHAVRASAAAGRQRSAHVVDARAPRCPRERGRYAVRERRFWRCGRSGGAFALCTPCARTPWPRATAGAGGGSPSDSPLYPGGVADMLARTSRTCVPCVASVHSLSRAPVEIVQLAETSITYRTFVYESLLFFWILLFRPFGRARFQATNSDSK